MLSLHAFCGIMRRTDTSEGRQRMQVVETFGKMIENWSDTSPARAQWLLKTGWEAQNLKNQWKPDRRLLPAD